MSHWKLGLSIPRSYACRSRAKDLCPDLIVVPYMFDKYEETSEKVGPAASWPHLQCSSCGYSLEWRSAAASMRHIQKFPRWFV